MNRYQKLMSNTVIFAVGTFSSKLLVFFMTRFYTAALTHEQFSTSDLITQASLVIIPIASVGITNAVIRYGLESRYSKHEVFSVGLFVILAGSAVLALCSPLINILPNLTGYSMLICSYVLCANLQSLCGQFIRARGHVRLYAIDGVCRTITTVVFNVLFLSAFGLGVEGYIASIVCSNLLSAVCLFFIDNLYRFVHIRAFNFRTAAQMLGYAIPLIPATICVWIFSASDRFFVVNMCGDVENSLYTVANKIPTILVIISGIFIEAWQISTIDGSPKKEQEDFFSKVGNVYQALLFVLASGIIMTAKLSTSILAVPSYYEGWKFIPLLVFGSTFACLSNFQNSIYTLEKKSVASFATALFGALLNIALNFALIPKWGGNGAAFATLISYIAMFLLRAVHTRQYLRVRWHIPRFTITFLLLCIQSALMLWEGRYWVTQQLALFLLIALLGSQDLMVGVRKVLHRR